MTSLRSLLLALPLLAAMAPAGAVDIALDLSPDQRNPVHPTMGDWLHFRCVIRNTGSRPIHGLVAWISLVEVTPGREQPMDLEDWSAHKAVAGASLAPGKSLPVDWPLRLIQGGDYRVVVSATDGEGRAVVTSPMLGFHSTTRPVISSERVVPVAAGVPLLIVAAMLYAGWRRRRQT